jgi:hypothetical protein
VTARWTRNMKMELTSVYFCVPAGACTFIVFGTTNRFVVAIGPRAAHSRRS